LTALLVTIIAVAVSDTLIRPSNYNRHCFELQQFIWNLKHTCSTPIMGYRQLRKRQMTQCSWKWA